MATVEASSGEGLSGLWGNFNPVGEAGALDDFAHQLVAVEPASFGFAFASEFAGHAEGGAARAAALGLAGAVTHHGEARFDPIARAQMHPVGGGKVVEAEQRGALLVQALPGFGVFVRVAFLEGIRRGNPRLPLRTSTQRRSTSSKTPGAVATADSSRVIRRRMNF